MYGAHRVSATLPRMMKACATIDEYISLQPKAVRPLLEQLRACIRKVAPKAIEAISYGIPTFKLHGNLVHFGAYEQHIGFYPGAAAMEFFRKAFVEYSTSKGTVRFPLNQPLPLKIVRDVVKFRVAHQMTKKKAK